MRRSGGTATADEVGVFTGGKLQVTKQEKLVNVIMQSGSMAATVHVSAMHS